MVEVKLGVNAVDVPFLLRLYGVTKAQFNEWVDEDTRAELIDGVMIVHSPATPTHDDLAGFLRGLMRFFAEERELGKVFGPDALVRLIPERCFGPDVFFLDTRQVPQPLPNEFECVPALVVEILSPSNRDYDLEEKRQAYQQAGVREIWLVDPREQQLLVDRRRGRRYLARTISTGRFDSSVLSGFWVDVAWLWADPLPNSLTCLRRILGESL